MNYCYLSTSESPVYYRIEDFPPGLSRKRLRHRKRQLKWTPYTGPVLNEDYRPITFTFDK